MLLISLAGCAPLPPPYVAPDPFAEALVKYRALDCDALAVSERGFNTALEKTADVSSKPFWQRHIAAVKQVRLEKKCPTTSARPMLGIRLDPLLPAAARPLGLPNAKGALIGEVMTASAAERAGLVAGDVILGINGQKLATAAEVAAAIGQPEAGARIEVLVWRNRRQQVVLVDFGAPVAKAAPAAGSLMDAATADFDAARYTDAARKYQQVLQQSPQDTLAWYFYGQTMEKLRDVIGAQDAYRRVLSIQPEGQVADYARQALEKLAPNKKAAKKK
ncbi:MULTISPECIES: PDZ domain-containing protein [unclassified Herbaspirillum]|uniref:PDZ domain-containing protein n=1 Tax=unclassified Herbaspirillum TaxID=2624150 RepID=UPI001314A9FD|nr:MULTISPECIES: PDZ domain-containing protein [unclassified Herbaspirillum]